MTQIVNKYPPNYKEIIEKIPGVEENKKIIFAYDGKIYNPHKNQVDHDLIVHENVHFKQQEDYGGAKEWWERYLNDTEFRLSQELEAYAVQYNFLKKFFPEKILKRFKEHVYSLLSSDMYGNIVDYHKAGTLLRFAIKDNKNVKRYERV